MSCLLWYAVSPSLCCDVSRYCGSGTTVGLRVWALDSEGLGSKPSPPGTVLGRSIALSSLGIPSCPVRMTAQPASVRSWNEMKQDSEELDPCYFPSLLPFLQLLLGG